MPFPKGVYMRMQKMWETEIEWSDTKRIKNAMITELSGKVLKIDFNVYLCSKEKIVFWRVIRMIYQLFRDQLEEKCDHILHLGISLRNQ